jgi:hypothetical protein
VHDFEVCLLGILAAAVGVGVWSIWWVRGRGHSPSLRTWGGRLYITSLLVLGVGNMVALVFAVGCLLPYGLSAGWLVIAMLWENPIGSGCS